MCVRHELGGCSAETPDGTAGTRAEACETVASAQRALVSAVEPLLMAYGVDVYHAGHVHDYESTWPISNGSITQPSYHAPQGRRLPVERCMLRAASPALCPFLEPTTVPPTLQSTLECSAFRRS